LKSLLPVLRQIAAPRMQEMKRLKVKYCMLREEKMTDAL